MLPGALTQAEFEARMDEFRCVRVQCFVCLTRRHGAIAAIFLASRFLLSIHTHQGQASPAPAAPHRALLHHGAAQWPVRAAARQGMRLRQGAGECMLWGGGRCCCCCCLGGRLAIKDRSKLPSRSSLCAE